jgi:hypothetical protein
VLTLQELVSVAGRHSAAEAEDDLDTTLATLDDDAFYELQPMGRLLTGADRVRRYYEWFFSDFRPRVVGYELRYEATTEAGVLHEYAMKVRHDDGEVHDHAMIGILVPGERGLRGERLYASEELMRMLLGPLYDETEPIA